MKYFAEFYVLGDHKTLQLTYEPVVCVLSDDEVLKRMNITKYGGKQPTDEEIHAAKQILARFPQANNIYILEATENKTSQSGEQSDKSAFVLLIGAILAVLLAAIFITLGMNGHFLLKGFYSDRGGKGWKKFKKIYIPIGFVLLGVGLILIIAGAVRGVSGLVTGGLFGLFGGNIVYFILSIVLSKKYKGMTDEEEICGTALKTSEHADETDLEPMKKRDLTPHLWGLIVIIAICLLTFLVMFFVPFYGWSVNNPEFLNGWLKNDYYARPLLIKMIVFSVAFIVPFVLVFIKGVSNKIKINISLATVAFLFVFNAIFVTTDSHVDSLLAYLERIRLTYLSTDYLYILFLHAVLGITLAREVELAIKVNKEN